MGEKGVTCATRSSGFEVPNTSACLARLAFPASPARISHAVN